ncbi:MAG: hypothetical protein LBH53_01720 [Puniceicoccales bacterium]|nr:hypothetical protein [Puniceicoccales bacterium]
MGASRSFGSSTSVWVLSALLSPLISFFLLTGSHRARYRQDLGRRNVLLTKQIELKERVGEIEGYLRRFASDGDFRRRTLRKRLGYTDRDEYVYIFEE